MKAYVIDATDRSIDSVELSEGLPDIRSLIGYETVDSDELDASGDRLFFDESCFLRDETGKGRFKIDNLAPVAGKAVVVGSSDDGEILKDVIVDVTTLQRRITWL